MSEAGLSRDIRPCAMFNLKNISIMMNFDLKITKGTEVLVDVSITAAKIPDEYLKLFEMVKGTEMVVKRKN